MTAPAPGQRWHAKGPRDRRGYVVTVQALEQRTARVTIPASDGWPFPTWVTVPLSWLRSLAEPRGGERGRNGRKALSDQRRPPGGEFPDELAAISEEKQKPAESAKLGGRSGRIDLRTGKPHR